MVDWSMALGLCEHFSFHDEEQRTLSYTSTGLLFYINDTTAENRRIKTGFKRDKESTP